MQQPKGSVEMSLLKERFYTVEDIYNLPEGKRAELIDGQIYDMAPPKRTHQKILSFLHLEIGNYIKSKGGSCEVYPAPFAVFLDNDEYTCVEPDISVICDKSKLDEQRNLITVYAFEHEEVLTYTFEEQVKAEIYEDLFIDFSAISLEEN